MKRHTKLAHSSLRAVAPAFRVIAAFRAARALEEEAIPSKRRFRENESVQLQQNRAREGKHVRGLGAFARRPLVIITCPANQSISRIRTWIVVRKKDFTFLFLFYLYLFFSLSFTTFNLQLYMTVADRIFWTFI